MWRQSYCPRVLYIIIEPAWEAWRLTSDGRMYRKSKYKYANGDTYQGEFKAGKRHGRGKKTVAATGETITGLWSEDKFVKAA